jgi:hypothetical protein
VSPTLSLLVTARKRGEKTPNQALGTPKTKNLLSVVAIMRPLFLGDFQIPAHPQAKTFSKNLQ